MCVVEGGPEYRCALSGESSTIGFLIDRSVIDFKNVLFTSKKEEELVIHNTGKVVFNYAVVASNDALGLFDIVPSAGTYTRTRTCACTSSNHIFTVVTPIPCTVYSYLLLHFYSLQHCLQNSTSSICRKKNSSIVAYTVSHLFRFFHLSIVLPPINS